MGQPHAPDTASFVDGLMEQALERLYPSGERSTVSRLTWAYLLEHPDCYPRDGEWSGWTPRNVIADLQRQVADLRRQNVDLLRAFRDVLIEVMAYSAAQVDEQADEMDGRVKTLEERGSDTNTGGRETESDT